MTALIERVRLSTAAKQQLSTLKRRTGIEHYNVICRHALCVSLANPANVPDEQLNYGEGLEIEWRTFAGESESILLNILIVRVLKDESEVSSKSVRKVLQGHLHRGLSYLLADPNSLHSKSLAAS